MSSFASTSAEASDLSTVLRTFAAGALATASSKCITAPVERIKLVLQLQNQSSLTGPSSASSRPYVGMVDCYRSLIAEQGFASLYRGNLANVAKCLPNHALNFVLRDQYRLLFLKNVNRKEHYGQFVLGNFMAGAAGGTTSLCLTYPLDVARTRLAVETNKNGTARYRGIYDCLRTISQKEGIFGTYKGFIVSLQFVAVSRAIFFGMFDTIRGTLVEDTRQLHFFAVFFLAQICVISSGLLAYPLDTVRRKLMLQSGQNIKEFNGSIDCLMKTFRRGGINAFYRGAVTNSVKSSSGALLVALYYEIIKYM